MLNRPTTCHKSESKPLISIYTSYQDHCQQQESRKSAIGQLIVPTISDFFEEAPGISRDLLCRAAQSHITAPEQRRRLSGRTFPCRTRRRLLSAPLITFRSRLRPDKLPFLVTGRPGWVAAPEGLQGGQRTPHVPRSSARRPRARRPLVNSDRWCAR